MTLVFDRRPQLAGQAMTHAFLAGVSDYVNLSEPGQPPAANSQGLRKLDSPALSAWQLCCWLVEHGESLSPPLGTLRLLMSASAAEAAAQQPDPVADGWLGGNIGRATQANFQSEVRLWRTDASTSPSDSSIFYFGGHGLKQFNDTLMLFEDFAGAAGPLLAPTCRVQNLLDGMAPDPALQPNIARTQFYFIDCCRQNLTDFRGLASKPTEIWDPVDGVDNRATPTFMGSFPGAVALSMHVEPTDFATALITALETAAEDEDAASGKWPVRSTTIHNALDRHFKASKTGQYVPATGNNFGDVVLRFLDGPPPTRFEVTVSPAQQIGGTSIQLDRIEGGYNASFPAPDKSHPYVVEAPAGIFKLTAKADGPEKSKLRLVNQRLQTWPVDMDA